MNIKEFSKYAGLSAIIVGGAVELSRWAIIRGIRRYQNNETSEPISKTADHGSYTVKTTQTLVGKYRGGRVITERHVVFKHELGNDSYRSTSQSLRSDKEITLTDGTRARGE